MYTDSSRQGGEEAIWEPASPGGDGRGTPYPLTEPVRGDVILVRTGVLKGRAIGIVHQNDYAEPGGLNEQSRLHVYWINKSEAEFRPRRPDCSGGVLRGRARPVDLPGISSCRCVWADVSH